MKPAYISIYLFNRYDEKPMRRVYNYTADSIHLADETLYAVPTSCSPSSPAFLIEATHNCDR